jgi:hypothetical protein
MLEGRLNPGAIEKSWVAQTKSFVQLRLRVVVGESVQQLHEVPHWPSWT